MSKIKNCLHKIFLIVTAIALIDYSIYQLSNNQTKMIRTIVLKIIEMFN